MLFSRSAEYAIRAMLYVAKQPDGQLIPVRDIAEALHKPYPALAKIVQKLARERLLRSHRGPGGGVSLGRSASEITVLNVVAAIDGLDRMQECVLGIPGCSEATQHCPLHDEWGSIRERIVNLMGNQSIAQVVEQLEGEEFVLGRAPGPW